MSKQASNQAGRQKSKQAIKQAGRQASKQAGKQADRKASKQARTRKAFSQSHTLEGLVREIKILKKSKILNTFRHKRISHNSITRRLLAINC